MIFCKRLLSNHALIQVLILCFNDFVGTALPRQTILPGDRDPLCIVYSLPETAHHSCVRKLREKHCPKGEAKIARKPLQMSVRSLSGPSRDSGFFLHTSFRASFKLYSCVEDNSAEKSKRL